MTAAGFVVIDRMTHVTPFGMGLWDTSALRLASEGISVTLHALSGDTVGATVNAFRTRGGLFAAHELPGLHQFETAEPPWPPSSPPHAWLVVVRDAARQFIPFVVHVPLPVIPPGTPDVRPADYLALPPCTDLLWPAGHLSSPVSPLASPVAPNAPAYVPLFPSSSHGVPAGRAVVRASLVVDATGAAAAGAVLEVRSAGELVARGIADDRGEVVAMFAYPEPPAAPPTSPGGGASLPQPLARQWWPLDIAVRFGDTGTYPKGATDALPDLCELLTQPYAVVRMSFSPVPVTDAVLRYGEDLVLGAPLGAELFISPA